jgi:hypothetical protein
MRLGEIEHIHTVKPLFEPVPLAEPDEPNHEPVAPEHQPDQEPVGV